MTTLAQLIQADGIQADGIVPEPCPALTRRDYADFLDGPDKFKAMYKPVPGLLQASVTVTRPADGGPETSGSSEPWTPEEHGHLQWFGTEEEAAGLTLEDVVRYACEMAYLIDLPGAVTTAGTDLDRWERLLVLREGREVTDADDLSRPVDLRTAQQFGQFVGPQRFRDYMNTIHDETPWIRNSGEPLPYPV